HAGSQGLEATEWLRCLVSADRLVCSISIARLRLKSSLSRCPIALARGAVRGCQAGGAQVRSRRCPLPARPQPGAGRCSLLRHQWFRKTPRAPTTRRNGRIAAIYRFIEWRADAPDIDPA